MREPPGLHWESFIERGDEHWIVQLVEPRHCRLRGVEVLGLTSFKLRQIRINVAQPLDEIGPTYLHERMRAAANNGRCERFIRTVERPIWEMLMDHGFKLPAYPRGFHAFRERVVEVRQVTE